MTTVTQEWLGYQEELLGRIAACKETLTDITEGADLEKIEESIEELQRAISESNQDQMDEDEEEESEEDEKEGDEEEDEEEE